jgi:hypothetical protein
MNCPFCSAELAPDTFSCPACHAFQSVERTPLGVFAGWVGVLSAVLTAMVLAFIPFILFSSVSMTNFPWILPGIGIALSAAAFWYSRSTRHIVWLQRQNIL